MGDVTAPTSQNDKFTVRVPPALRRRLRAMAGEHDKSMNAYITELLERGVSQDERKESPHTT